MLMTLKCKLRTCKQMIMPKNIKDCVLAKLWIVIIYAKCLHEHYANEQLLVLFPVFALPAVSSSMSLAKN